MNRRGQDGRGSRGRVGGFVPFTPKQLSGLAAWYTASSVAGAQAPNTINGLAAWYRADSITGAAPNTISGCTGWFRADSLSALGNGASVATWTDGSGNGHDITQASGPNQPTFTSSSASFNNQPCVHFNATTGQWLENSNWSTNSNITFVIIGQDDGVHVGYAGTYTGDNWWLVNSGGHYAMVGAAAFSTGIVPTANTPRVFVGTDNGSNSAVWYVSSGLATASGGAPGIATDTGVTIGSQQHSSAGTLTGDIVEVAVFNRALTQAEVAQIQIYAAKRYGIAATLPVPQWDDESASGDINRNSSQSTPANQPTLNISDSDFGGQPSLSFPNANWLLTGTWSVAPVSAPLTIAVIGKQTRNAANTYFVDALNPSAQVAIYADSSLQSHVISTVGGVDFTNGVAVNVPSIMIGEVAASGNPYLLASNSNTGASSTASTGSASFNGLTIGDYAGLGTFSGTNIAEIAVFTRALSQSEIQALAAYAAQRYGITISIGTLNDQSGTGDANKNAAQATQSNQPTLTLSDAAYNHRPTLSFTVANSSLKSAAWSVAPPTTATVFIVGNDGNTIAEAFIDGNTVNSYLVEDGGSGTSVAWGQSLYPTIAVSGHLGNPSAMAFTFNGANSSAWFNAKTPIATGQNVGTSAPTLITLGNKADNTGPLNGKLAEVLIYSRILSQGEVSKVLSYLGQKYGVAIGA